MCDAQCESDCTVRHVAACVVAKMCVVRCGIGKEMMIIMCVLLYIEREMMMVVCGGMDWC